MVVSTKMMNIKVY